MKKMRLSIPSYFEVILEFKHNMSLPIVMSSMMTTSSSSSSSFKLDNQSEKSGRKFHHLRHM